MSRSTEDEVADFLSHALGDLENAQDLARVAGLLDTATCIQGVRNLLTPCWAILKLDVGFQEAQRFLKKSREAKQ